MQIKKALNRNLLYLFLLSIILLTGFHILRIYKNPHLPGYDQYYFLNNILSLKEDFSPSLFLKDTYVFDVFLSFSEIPAFWMRIVPYFFGLVNITLIYFIFNEICKNKKQIFFSSLFVVFSPLFIQLYGTYNRVFSSMFGLLLGTYLLLKDKYFGSLIFLIVGFILNPELFLVIIFILLIFYEKYKAKKPYLPVLGILLTCFLFIRLKNYNLLYSGVHGLLTNYVSDFGALYGMGVFTVFVSLLGLVMSWSNKDKYTIFYFSLLSLLICSLFDHSLLFFVQITISYFGGLAVTNIWKGKWKSTTLKNYVLLLIFCGVVFSSGSFINSFSQAGPFHKEISSLEWLKDHNQGGVVLSHYKFGFLIESISGLDSYVDQQYYTLSKDKTRIKTVQNIFKSRNLEEILTFLKKNNIRYIWITEEMKEGLVWEREEEGILLILENSNNFKKIYKDKKVEIWMLRTTGNVGI